MNERRYDIDWIRVIAIGLLLIYHIAIGFQPWGTMIGFITNRESMDWLWIPMSVLNTWRIPLLFFVSGMGVYFAMRRRNLKQLITERTKRIFIPFLFGFLLITPLHLLIFQKNYSLQLSYMPNAGHLWFLGNIFVYVLVLAPIFFWLMNNPEGKMAQAIAYLFKRPFGFLLIGIGFVTETLLVKPGIFALYAMTWHGFFLGFFAFSMGFLTVFSGEGFWANLSKWKWLLVALAITLSVFRIVYFNLQAPNYLMSMESVTWILSVFGFGHQFLNRPSLMLNYLSKSAYPIYIIHMIFLYLASWIIFPLDMSPLLKLVMVILLTFVGCLVTYEFLIRRISFLKPFFGVTK